MKHSVPVDYVYASTRKIYRLGATQKAPLGARLRKVQANVAWVGGALELDAPTADVLARIPKIEAALDASHGISDVTEPALVPSRWFRFELVDMCFGIPHFNDPETDHRFSDSAIFCGQVENVRLVLGGSANYLLDRPGGDGRTGLSPSVLHEMGELLAAARSDALEDSGTERAYIRSGDEAEPPAVPFEYLMRELGRHGLQPLRGVARAAQVSVSSGYRYVIGSPLYVAFDVTA